MASKREKFIKEKAFELCASWMSSPTTKNGVVDYFEKAVRLGMENADIQDDVYEITEEQLSASGGKFSLSKNNSRIVDFWYGGVLNQTREEARELAQKLLNILENE